MSYVINHFGFRQTSRGSFRQGIDIDMKISIRCRGFSIG